MNASDLTLQSPVLMRTPLEEPLESGHGGGIQARLQWRRIPTQVVVEDGEMLLVYTVSIGEALEMGITTEELQTALLQEDLELRRDVPWLERRLEVLTHGFELLRAAS